MIEIRNVKQGDEKNLAYIQTESWKKAFIGILPEEELEHYADVHKAEEMYRGLLADNIGNGLLMMVEGNPHCIAYWDRTREENMKGYAELICIHSLCDNWGKGYGSQMMEYIIEEMRAFGFHKVMLWVFEKNERARRFYERHGFYKTEHRKMFGDAVEVMYCREI